MKNRMAVILAAGKGTRMKSNLYKVLHPICGLPMVEHVIRAVKQCDVNQIVTIVGHGAEQVQEVLGASSEYAVQSEQLGTGHAVLQAQDLLAELDGTTLVICGDTPLFTAETLQQLFQSHDASQAQATILTAIADDSTGYGRIVRADNDDVVKIVEHKDASPAELAIKEISTGTYIFDNKTLFEALANVKNDNAQGEYYLPDVIELIKAVNGKVSAHVMDNMDEGLGINDRVALSQAQQLMSERINEKHMRNGVSMMNPTSTYIEADVIIGNDTVVEAGVLLKGKTVIGSNCFIGANSEIVDSQLADHVKVTQSVIESAIVGEQSTVGPYAHLRPNSELGKEVHIGNFVEVKNSTLGDETKAGHLAYIGDADVGADVNVGCGTIFVNYNGKEKFRSQIGDQAFIGSNANIVAPVNVGDRAFIASGSTITKDVPSEALSIGRSEQKNVSNYWNRLSKK